MAVNDFSSSWARIQSDRNQTVVTQGAYRWIRHPMYLAVIVSALSVPLVLDSYWALIPGILVVAVTVYRTVHEDRMLVSKLPGYESYTSIVRCQLFPGLW